MPHLQPYVNSRWLLYSLSSRLAREMGSGRSTRFLIISIALVLSALSVVAVIAFIIFERWKHKKKVELAKQIEQEEEQQEKRKKVARKRKEREERMRKKKQTKKGETSSGSKDHAEQGVCEMHQYSPTFPRLTVIIRSACDIRVKKAVEDYLKSQLETGVVATTRGGERWDAIAGQPAELRRGISVTAKNKFDVNEAVRKMSEVSKELDEFGG